YGKGITNGRLDEETVQHRAVIAVIIEAVDELLVKARFLRMRAPDDALVQVGDAQAVILGIVLEQQLIQALGHMVDGARIGRVKDFLRDRVAGKCFYANSEVTLRNGRTNGGVAINAHGAEMHQMRIEAHLDQGVQQIVHSV